MEMIKLNYLDLLICDPCYIKGVKCRGENRFDALKCVETLHDGDDGCYVVKVGDKETELGVDSGRIWVLQVEFGCEVEIDSGLSGHIVIKKDDPNWGKEITKE